MGEIEVNYGSTLPTESLKVIAESVGIGNLSDDAAKEISDSATYRLKLVLQVSSTSRPSRSPRLYDRRKCVRAVLYITRPI